MTAKEKESNVYEKRTFGCHKPVIPVCYLCSLMSGRTWVWEAWVTKQSHEAKFRVIPVVTFLTPLAEYFSDLKDR
jgi:hypothetical protein